MFAKKDSSRWQTLTGVRDDLAALNRMLAIPYEQTRCDHHGIVAIAGARGRITPVDGALAVILRTTAPVAVKQQLITTGLLVESNGALMLARIPDGAEVAQLRELLGLRAVREQALN